METSLYSKETKTVIGLFEHLSETRRKDLLEKIQELVAEQESESKWDYLLETSPEPMIDMAKEALVQYKSGKSKKLKF